MNTNKISFFGKIVICNFLFAFLFTSGMYAQTCNAKLVVEKGRNSRSIAQGDPTVYTLLLTNTSGAASEYSVITKFNSGACGDSNRNIAKSDLNLSSKVLSADSFKKPAATRRNLNKIKLSPGQTYKFYVEVSTAEKSQDNVWSCTEVLAIGTNCDENNAAKTTLKTYLRSASDE